MKASNHTPTPAARVALHTIGNCYDSIRGLLNDSYCRAALPISMYEHLGKAKAELNAAFDELVNKYHKEACND